MQRLRVLYTLLLIAFAGLAGAQQTLPFALRLQGLRSVQHQGGFKAAAFLADGTLALLLDQGDGLRVLKTDAGATTVLAEAHLGAAEDAGVALATDGVGNIYVGGTSSSGALTGTPGAAFSSPEDTSVNSFVAKFDAGLHLTFLSFLGAGTTALTGVAVTGDAVFATGVTYSAALPATSGTVLPSPASGMAGNGFVERLSTDGRTVVYATYLTGAGGSTTPAGIVADALDHAYIAGSTSSPNFSSVAGLQPTMLGTASGFLAKLTPAGDSFVFSTFVAGAGLASVALDVSTGNLLVTGDLSPGQFPVMKVAGPIAATPYQAVLRVSGDGQTLLDSALLLPGTHSLIAAGPNGTAWVTGSLSAPASQEQADAGEGDSYLLHLSSEDEIDAIFRLGGHPTSAPEYARLRSIAGPPALSAGASAVVVPSTLQAATDPSIVANQTFDLGLAVSGNALLPSTAGDLLPPTCSPGLPCSGSGGLLALFGAGSSDGASLLLSGGNSPVLTVRNAGPGTADGLQLAASGFSLNTNCSPTLPAGAQCGALVVGSSSGSVTATAADASPATVAISTLPAASAQGLVFDTAELDFGIVTAAGPAVSRTITITNLGTATQTFASNPVAVPSSLPYVLREAASTCDGPPAAHTLPANGSCAVTVALSAASSPDDDSTVQASWSFGDLAIPVSGFTQSAALTVSSLAIDFGASSGTSTTRLPRFLYLSNASPFAIAHAPIASPAGQPFTVNDDCPTTLQPDSTCQIGLVYTQTSAPAIDTFTLPLDEGLSVLITGETLAASPTAASLASLPLSVSPRSVQFQSSVPVSGVSTEVQVVSVTNTSSTALALDASVLGDFLLQNTCPTLLPAQASCDLGISFAPSEPSVREGLLTLSAGAGYSMITVPLSGTGEGLLELGNEYDLGETPVDEPVTAWFQVEGSLPNLSLAVSGAGFGIAMLPDDGSGHGTLDAQAFRAAASGPCTRCWLGLQFLPLTPGAALGKLQVSTAADGNPYLVTLQGYGLAGEGLLLTPVQRGFGALPVHSTSEPIPFTLANMLASAAPVSIQQVSVSGDFQLVGNPDPPTCAGTLAPTAACSLQVAFAPTQLGARAGTLTVLTSAGAITATLAGTGTASANLTISPTTLTFPRGIAQTVTLTNAGTSGLFLLPPTVSGSAFSVSSTCAMLAPGRSCTATVSFGPEVSPVLGTLTFPASSKDAAGQSVTEVYAIPLNGVGTSASATLSLFPSGADFGTGATGSLAQVRQFSLINTSSATLGVSLAAARNFPLAAPPACDLLAAGATCTFSVVFLPETAGPLTGTLVATATRADGTMAGQALAYLQGYGVSPGALGISDGTDAELPLNFGQVGSGQTASQVLTLTNTGGTPVTLRRVSSTAPFQAESQCPSALTAGSSCRVIVSYVPNYQVDPNEALAPRADHGTLVIESDAATSPDTIYLSGVVRPSILSAAAPSGSLPTYTLSESALTFPNTQPGVRSSTQTITLFNSGFAPVVFRDVLTPPSFAVSTDCAVLAPGASCSVSASFTPDAGAAPSLQAGTLEILSNAAAAMESVSLLGSSFASPLQVIPATPDFGSVLLGSAAQITLKVTNVSTLPVSLGQIAGGGDFSVGASSCPAPGGALPAGQSCTLTISFSPMATGVRSATLTIASPDLAEPLGIPLTGTGVVGQLKADPGSLQFGTVNLNARATLTVYLSNIGTAALSGLGGAVAGPDAVLFTWSSACPGSLPVGAMCDVQVSFNPVQTGPRTATLALTSSDPKSRLLLPLSGTGAEPPGFVLTVSGGHTGTASVQSGDAAVFPLLVTPQGGYLTPVALSCTPVRAAPNATCSLSGAEISLNGGPGAGSATISTLSGLRPASPLPWTWLLWAPGLFAFRRRSGRLLRRSLLAVGVLGLGTSALLGCGGNIGVEGYPYTPPGTYAYQVTARSTAGAPLASSVTLTVNVE